MRRRLADRSILAQLLPLALGAAVKRVAPDRAPRIGIALGRAGAILLLAALISILINVRYSILLRRTFGRSPVRWSSLLPLWSPVM